MRSWVPIACGLACWLVLVTGCNTPAPKAPPPSSSEVVKPVRDFDDIVKRGKLIALTDYSSSSYYIYKGEPMGYEYDLLKVVAQHLEVDLEIKVVDNLDLIFEDLNNEVGDVVAANMTVTRGRSDLVSFTEPLLETPQVLVQRLPDGHRKKLPHQYQKDLIRNPIHLAGKKVYVRKNSSFYARLQNLSEEIGAEIDIVEVAGDVETEELIEMVANGQIDYTIADKNVARLNQIFYSNLDIETAVSFPQRIAWAVRKGSPELLSAINEWIRANRGNSDYATIYNKYFRSRKAHKRRVESDYSSLSGGKISDYDDLIRQHSERLGWDWRLVAAVVYEESHFDPEARAWTGATGLMQILPNTALGFDVDSIQLKDPERNIYAGVSYLKQLEAFWAERIQDSLQCIKFTLASYNVGLGHLIDARKLCEKYEANPDVWEDNVSYYLKEKNKPKFYNDPVVKFGYCRGQEPFRYVKNVLARFDHYVNAIPA